MSPVKRTRKGLRPLARLVKIGSDDVQRAVANNPYTPPWVLQKLAASDYHITRRDAVFNPSFPPWLLDQYAGSGDESLRAGVAINPNTSSKDLAILAGDDVHEVRLGVAGNPSTPVSVLEEMASSPSIEIIEQVIANSTTPLDLALDLARRRGVRYQLLLRPDISQKLVEGLAHDKSYLTRQWVAERPEISAETLRLLLNDPPEYNSRVALHKWVRRAAAENPNLSDADLRQLLDDAELRASAIRNPRLAQPQFGNLLTELANSGDWATQTTVAQNPKCPPELLWHIGLGMFRRPPDNAARVAAARNPNLHWDAFTTLAVDKAPEVRRAIAQNPSTPSALLKKLAKANPHDQYLLEAVAENYRPPLAELEFFLPRDYSPPTLRLCDARLAPTDFKYADTPAKLLVPIPPEEVNKFKFSAYWEAVLPFTNRQFDSYTIAFSEQFGARGYHNGVKLKFAAGPERLQFEAGSIFDLYDDILRISALTPAQFNEALPPSALIESSASTEYWEEVLAAEGLEVV